MGIYDTEKKQAQAYLQENFISLIYSICAFFFA